jgi:hypothetical protein
MSTDDPAPLTPSDCDLRGLPFMPLDVVRLGDSDLVALSTGDEFKAAVLLWGKAWLQVPAASLPDDPRILAHLSGSGSRWSKVAAVALRGWVKCSDGRLYHPVIAEKAREAWSFRLLQRERSKRANEKRWGSRGDDARDAHGMPDASPEASPRGPRKHPHGDPHGDARRDPKGQGQGQGKEETPSPPSGAPSPGGSTALGMRLPEDWQPSEADRQFAHSLGHDPDALAAGFRDYWRSKPGKDGRKADWSATWRNWCRSQDRFAHPRGGGAPSPTGKSKVGWMNDPEAFERMAAE